MEECDKKLSRQQSSDILCIIGDAWTLRILIKLSERNLRFCEIEREVIGINPTTLTARLKKLEESNFIQKNEDITNKQAIIYSLMQKGKEVLPIIDEIKQFMEKNSK